MRKPVGIAGAACLPARPPIGLSVCPHVSAWLPMDGFSQNLILGTCMKNYLENPNWVKIRQKYLAFYKKTC
jgi:hypothetical protein